MGPYWDAPFDPCPLCNYHNTRNEKVEYPSCSSKRSELLKFSVTLSFLFLTSLTFANRRTLMGFDIMSMDVAVMQSSLLQGERFLVDTWVQKWT